MSLSLRFLVSVIACLGAMAMAPVALANSKYAALVMHAETGDILFDRYADERRYPASLTKMMTLYLVFEALENGDIKLTDKMYVSKHASLQPASRLGLARGTSITVEDAIEALVIRSANDAATVVAEKLGGTETKFARLMTEKARQIGMRKTTFRNASGLPDPKQVTTARDMAILSQRLTQDFPQYYHYFAQKNFAWGGRTYSSHNRVQLTYDGADGIKTGYTRASGYNLSTSAKRGDHRLIGIVLGGRSASTRDSHMKEILTTAFTRIEKTPSIVKAVHQVRPIPRLKPGREAPLTLAALAAANTNSDVPMPTPKTLAMALPLTTSAPDLTDQPTTLDVSSLEMVIAAVASEGPVPEEPPPIGEGDAEPSLARTYAVQIGAYHEEKQALARIRDTESTVRAVALIPGREVRISASATKPLYRARFTRMTEDEAEAACDALKAQRTDCIVLRAE